MTLTYDTAWKLFGFFFQGLFFMRFALQWLHSERARQSIIPVGFWWCSLFGGLGMTVYAVHGMDPVFIVGQGLGLVVYARNLLMIYRRPKAETLGRAPQVDGDVDKPLVSARAPR